MSFGQSQFLASNKNSDKDQEMKKLDHLPEDCIVCVLSCTSPLVSSRFSTLSSAAREAAESEMLWESFLPSDYKEIMSRLVSPLTFGSKKDLFLQLCTPLLIDEGKKVFSIDRWKNKKCYILSARKLSITWASNHLYWCWKPLLKSRFPEGVELVMVSWLEIKAKISTSMLSPNTLYGAYLIIKLAQRAFGLDSLPSEISLAIGNKISHGMVYLRKNKGERKTLEEALMLNRIETLRSRVHEGEERFVCEREDGWLEIELGTFYHDGSDKEVEMSLREVKGEHLKGGLIVEGIEVRPL